MEPIVDADGNFWIAIWGGQKVAAYRPDGSKLTKFQLLPVMLVVRYLAGETAQN